MSCGPTGWPHRLDPLFAPVGRDKLSPPMNAFFRSLLVAFLVLWLPLQSATALAMPLCAHMLGNGGRPMSMLPGDHVNAVANHHHDAGHEAADHQEAAKTHEAHHHASGTAHDVGDHTHAATANEDGTRVASADSPSSTCEECGLCQLACASVLPSTAQQFPVFPSDAPVAAAAILFLSITPSLLQRPPLAS